MTTDRDKFLTEAMGLCWHEEIIWNSTGYGKCPKCQFADEDGFGHIVFAHTDFSTWPGFGLLWEWAQKQEWFWLFCLQQIYTENSDAPFEKIDWDRNISVGLIHPDRFSGAVYAFLKEPK